MEKKKGSFSIPRRTASASKPFVMAVDGNQQEIGVMRGGADIQRMIDRFRYGTPTSREERAGMLKRGELKELWFAKSHKRLGGAQEPLISQSEAVAPCYGISSNQEASSRRYKMPIRKVLPQPEPQLETSNCCIPPCLAMDKSIDASCFQNASNSTSSDEGSQHLSTMGYHDSGGTQVHSSIQRGGSPLEATSYEVGGCIGSACILDQNSPNKRVRSSPTENASPLNHSIHSSPAAHSESIVVVVSNLDLVVTRLKEGIGAGIILDSTTSPIPHYDDKPMSKRTSSPPITLPEVAERLEADLIEFKKATEERERAEKDRNDAEEKWRVQERQKIEASVKSAVSYALFQAVGQVARQQFNDNNFGEDYRCKSIIDTNLQGNTQGYHDYDNGPATGLQHLISHIGDQISEVTNTTAVRRNEINAITTLKEAGIPSEIIDEARRGVATNIFTRTYVANQLSTAVANICGKTDVNCASMDEIKNNKALIISEETTESLVNAKRQISDTLDAAMKRLESILPNQVQHKRILNTTPKRPSHPAATNPKERTDSISDVASSVFSTRQRVENSEKTAAVFWDDIAMDKTRLCQEHKPLLGGSEKVCPRGAELHPFQPTTLYSFDRYMGLEEEEEEDYLLVVVPPAAAHLQYLHSVPSGVDFRFDTFSGGDFPVFKASQCAGGANTKPFYWEKYPYGCNHHFNLDAHNCSTYNKNVAITVTPDEGMLGMVKPSAPPAPSNSAEQRALASSIAEHSHELATQQVRHKHQDTDTFFAGDKVADRPFKFQDVPPMDTRNKLPYQDYHFEKVVNFNQQTTPVKSGTTLEGAAVLAARRSMKKKAKERLYLQGRQNDSALPRTLSCEVKTPGGGAFNHGIKGNEVFHTIEKEGYSASSAKLAEYKLMRQELVSSIT